MSSSAVNDDTSSTQRPSPLLDLPPELLVGHVLQPYLSIRDLQAFRQAARLCRELGGAAVACCVLNPSQDNTGVEDRLPTCFPNALILRIDCVGPVRAFKLQEGQLAALLPRMHCLQQLDYIGPCREYHPELDPTSALQALAHAQAAAQAAAAAAGGAGTSAAARPPPVLRVLKLDSGATHLHSELMEAVGALRGLESLELATPYRGIGKGGWVYMRPVAQLTALTALTISLEDHSICPLAGVSSLTNLSVLHLIAFASSTSDWSTALTGLAPCPLQSLTLFPRNGHYKLQPAALAAALTGLTHLDLNHCLDHTTINEDVSHLATLSNLRSLHVICRGWSLHSIGLGHAQLVLLAKGCPQLQVLQARFNLDDLPLPPWPEVEGVQSEDELSDVEELGWDEQAALAAGGGGSGDEPRRPSLSELTAQWPQQLRKLVLYSYSVYAPEFAKLLAGFPNLTSLVCNDVGHFPAMWNTLTAHPPPLRELVCDVGAELDFGVDGGSSAWLGAAFPQLRVLALSWNILNEKDRAGRVCTPSPTLASVLGDLPHLESLSVIADDSDYDSVGPSDWAALHQLSRLTRLELVGCHRLKREDFLRCAASLPLLQELVVKQCQWLEADIGRAWEQAAAAARASGAAALHACAPVRLRVVFEYCPAYLKDGYVYGQSVPDPVEEYW